MAADIWQPCLYGAPARFHYLGKTQICPAAGRGAKTEMDMQNNIVIRRGVLRDVADELYLERKVLIVTDKGVPREYAQMVADRCADPTVAVIEGGEENKSLATFEILQKTMLNNGFTRGDCVVSVGGGIVGDISGFAASAYMRGIDWYNIPTTVLSQVDSSIGGKTAVNFGGVKNIVGAFYMPKKVLIDADVLRTLPRRQIANGLVESIKMAAALDEDLFGIFEGMCNDEAPAETDDTLGMLGGVDIEDIIRRSIEIKRRVVSADAHEKNLRKVLNFGHTIGHGIEVASGGALLHGEAVGIGMLMMCSNDMRMRILRILRHFGLPTDCNVDKHDAINAIAHDKKSNANTITTVYVERPGVFEFRELPLG